MTQNDFKVMDWLRKVRNEHHEKTKNLTPEEMIQEIKDRAQPIQQQLDKNRKQNTPKDNNSSLES